jgi:hypothetical protein
MRVVLEKWPGNPYGPVTHKLRYIYIYISSKSCTIGTAGSSSAILTAHITDFKPGLTLGLVLITSSGLPLSLSLSRRAAVMRRSYTASLFRSERIPQVAMAGVVYI